MNDFKSYKYEILKTFDIVVFDDRQIIDLLTLSDLYVLYKDCENMLLTNDNIRSFVKRLKIVYDVFSSGITGMITFKIFDTNFGKKLIDKKPELKNSLVIKQMEILNHSSSQFDIVYCKNKLSLPGRKYFLKSNLYKYYWKKVKMFCRIIKILSNIFNHIIEKRYVPFGKGYYEAMKSFNNLKL